MAPALYERLVVTLIAATPNPTPNPTHTHTHTPAPPPIWASLLTQALQQPPHHRSRYQQLSILVSKLGGRAVAAPGEGESGDGSSSSSSSRRRNGSSGSSALIQAVLAACVDREVSSSASALMGEIIRGWSHAGVAGIHDAASSPNPNPNPNPNTNPAPAASFTGSAFEAYAPPAAALLLHSPPAQRAHLTDYLLPELIRSDPAAGGLLAVLRAADSTPTLTSTSHAATASPSDALLWALLHICLQCRLLGRPEGAIAIDASADAPNPNSNPNSTSTPAQPLALVHLSEISLAAHSPCPSLRHVALVLLATPFAEPENATPTPTPTPTPSSRKPPASPRTIPPAHLAALLAALPASLRCSQAEDR